MDKKIIEFNQVSRQKKMPVLRAGDIIKVHRKIIEGGKERVQVFEGIIISVKGKQSSSPMIRVRKVSEGVGVELIIPVYSPQVKKIEVVRQAKVRRAKLYYLRERSAKSLRMKYKELSEFAKGEEEEKKPDNTEKSEAKLPLEKHKEK
ncbi:MAG: 50S ribosomal protein L19 [Candidatus Moranbacteria bacterium]|nr:50S ribosomal protein L19 [Candidatus Moranbacteria bacterium]